MDLDDEELEATRRLNGAAKESDIEEDIKYVKECLKIARVFFKSIKAETDYKEIDDVAFCIAIDNILAERKQDKARIKELEEENRIQRRQLNSAFDRGWIPKQKVKDLIKNEAINISGFECIAVEDIEELLEEK